MVAAMPPAMEAGYGYENEKLRSLCDVSQKHTKTYINHRFPNESAAVPIIAPLPENLNEEGLRANANKQICVRKNVYNSRASYELAGRVIIKI